MIYDPAASLSALHSSANHPQGVSRLYQLVRMVKAAD